MELDDGLAVLSVGKTNLYDPEPSELLVAEAQAGLAALVRCMTEWMDLYPPTKAEVLTFVLAGSFGEDL